MLKHIYIYIYINIIEDSKKNRLNLITEESDKRQREIEPDVGD